MAWSRADLLSGPRHYVVRLDVGSRRLYFSHEALDILANDGTVIRVAAGLVADIDATRALQIQNTAVPLRSVSMAVITQAEDWAAIVANGWDLAASVAELSEWIPGLAWDDRRVIVSGYTDAPTYGARGEPLAFTLKNHPMQDRGAIPESTAVVDAVTWPDFASRALGRTYPTVIGKPGTLARFKTAGLPTEDRYPGSPALMVDGLNGILLVAGHEVEATTVQIADVTNAPTTWTTYSITHRLDGRGRKVATVTLSPVPLGSAEYAACWGYSGAGGGLHNRDKTAAMRSAGEVLEYLFARSTLQVDRGRTAAAVEQLRGYLVDCYIDEQVNVWEWIAGNLLPILPISIRYGPNGLYPVVWRSVIEDEQGAVLQHLNANNGDCVRVGVVQTSSTLHGDLTNTIRIAYGVDAHSGEHRGGYLLHGDPNTTTNGPTSSSSRITRVSVARYGEIPTELQTAVVWDPPTAAAVAYARALSSALAVRTVTYLAPQAFGWLEEGSGVQVTDAELSLSQAFGLVSEIEGLTDGSVRLQITLLDPIVRN